MTRVKNGVTTKARHKEVLKNAKGYFGSKHRLYKTAKEQLMHSGQYAFRDRRQKKRDFRVYGSLELMLHAVKMKLVILDLLKD